MIGCRDSQNILLPQFAVGRVNHSPEFTSVNEKHLVSSVAEPVVAFVPAKKPETYRNRRRVEKLAGERDHAVHEVGFDDGFANLAFAAGVGGHRAVGEDEAREAGRGEMVEEVLHPGEVGVADGWRAVAPARVVPEPVAAPVAHVEGRIGEDVVGLEVLVQVAMETVGVLVAEIGFDAANGEVHLRQLPRGRVALLTEDADVAFGFGKGVSRARVAIAGGVFFDELDRLHEHAARTAAGIEHAALVRGKHFDEQLDDAAGRVELPAFLAFRAGKLGEEILVHAPEDVFRPALRVAEADGGDEVDQFAEPLLVEIRACIVFLEARA